MIGRTMMVLSAMTIAVQPLSAQANCPMTYEFFEFAVPHLDLDACPAELAKPGVFCRASAAQDAAHVFVFSNEGSKCVVATKSYGAGQYELRVR